MRRILGYSMLISPFVFLYFIIGMCFESRKEGFVLVTTAYLVGLLIIFWVAIGTGLSMGDTFTEMYHSFWYFLTSQ
jgi:hypothetical protein